MVDGTEGVLSETMRAVQRHTTTDTRPDVTSNVMAVRWTMPALTIRKKTVMKVVHHQNRRVQSSSAVGGANVNVYAIVVVIVMHPIQNRTLRSKCEL
jgi:hypothetical protein